MRTILAKINILANAFEKDGNIETAELLHNVFIKISKKKKKSKGKNVPNNPSLWAQCKSQAKQKFDVYPSAYANGWAAKQYKSKGGTWRKASVNNTRLAQDENSDPQDNNLDPQVQKEQKDHTGFLFYDADKSNDIVEMINKLKELFSGQRTYKVNQNEMSKAEAAKTYYNAVRSHSPLFDPSKAEGILNRTYLDEEYNKLLIESQKRRINYNSAYEGIKRYILDGEGKTEFSTAQDYILSLNAVEEQNIKLMDFAKYVERLKVLSPKLDMKTYNIANQALYQAKLKAKSGSELNFRNVGSVNKILKNMLDNREIKDIDIYFIAIEMARLSSVIREN